MGAAVVLVWIACAGLCTLGELLSRLAQVHSEVRPQHDESLSSARQACIEPVGSTSKERECNNPRGSAKDLESRSASEPRVLRGPHATILIAQEHGFRNAMRKESTNAPDSSAKSNAYLGYGT